MKAVSLDSNCHSIPLNMNICKRFSLHEADCVEWISTFKLFRDFFTESNELNLVWAAEKMGVDDDIKQFEEWAERLGCSTKSLPPKKALNR